MNITTNAVCRISVKCTKMTFAVMGKERSLTMTPNEFVKLYMQNCQYRNEVSSMVVAIAKENGLVVVFGASDDLCERG